ncbi:rhodanese-like domain-containing protein [Chlorobium sp. KB01]|uniref:rhodanese-like domain-containing protein n=1 Tax=Chlorobium sp. KB01 TaxID=1917528 RepID=UPI000977F323|nr:rhodanese-like domain-containing protein [Chlorobium sp. KB01]
MSEKPLRIALIAAALLISGVSPALSPLHAAAPSALAKEESGELTLSAAKAIFDTHSACFVDARSEYAYYKLHIKGALSLSDSRFDEQFPDFRNKQAVNSPVIVYCANASCGKARHVAKMLIKKGYRSVRVFSGGLVEWVNAGFPVEG